MPNITTNHAITYTNKTDYVIYIQFGTVCSRYS